MVDILRREKTYEARCTPAGNVGRGKERNLHVRRDDVGSEFGHGGVVHDRPKRLPREHHLEPEGKIHRVDPKFAS
jgi:hypothetical protein